MTDATERDGEAGNGDRYFNRRFFLRGLGGVSLVGGAAALSAASGAALADDEGTETEDGEGGPEPAAEPDRFDEVDEDLPPLECGKPLAGELTEDSASTGEPGARHNHYYDVYTFEGSARERIGVFVSTDVSEPADPEGGIDASPSFEGTPVAILRDADGTVLAEGEETGYHGMDFFDATIPADGEYQLVVTSFGANETFEYSLDLNCRDRAPVLEEPPESVPIACGETIETDFVEGDRDRPLTVTHDVYCFQGTAGDVVTITTLTDEMGVTPLLYDPDGHQDPPSRAPETDEYDPRGTAVPVDGGMQISEYELPKTGTYKIWIGRNDWYDYQYSLTLECGSEE